VFPPVVCQSSMTRVFNTGNGNAHLLGDPCKWQRASATTSRLLLTTTRICVNLFDDLEVELSGHATVTTNGQMREATFRVLYSLTERQTSLRCCPVAHVDTETALQLVWQWAGYCKTMTVGAGSFQCIVMQVHDLEACRGLLLPRLLGEVYRQGSR
jgi:hypothetical protein